MKVAVVVATLLGLLGFAAYAAWQVWSSLDGVVISTHGMIAMGAGIVLTILVGGGLMTLVFFSARRGYDDIDDRSAPRRQSQRRSGVRLRQRNR